MTEEERREFGEYIKRLREQAGLSQRDVEADGRITAPYLSMIENGIRNPPKVEVLKSLAKLYNVSLKSLMAAAKMQETRDVELYTDKIDRAYRYVVEDDRFEFGTHMTTNELTTAGKRFIVEMYQKMTKVDLLAEIKKEENKAGH